MRGTKAKRLRRLGLRPITVRASRGEGSFLSGVGWKRTAGNLDRRPIIEDAARTKRARRLARNRSFAPGTFS